MMNLKIVTVISAQLAGIMQRMVAAAKEDEEYQDRIEETRSWGESSRMEGRKGTAYDGRRLYQGTAEMTPSERCYWQKHMTRGWVATLGKQRRWKSFAGSGLGQECLGTCQNMSAPALNAKLSKPTPGEGRGFLMPILAPEPWHTITMDLRGGSSTSQNHRKNILLGDSRQILEIRDAGTILGKGHSDRNC